MGFIAGLAFLAAALFLVRKAYRDGRASEREKFERTNSSGVQEFGSFEEYEAANNRDRSTAGQGAVLGCAAMALGLIGVGLIFASLGNLLAPTY